MCKFKRVNPCSLCRHVESKKQHHWEGVFYSPYKNCYMSLEGHSFSKCTSGLFITVLFTCLQCHWVHKARVHSNSCSLYLWWGHFDVDDDGGQWGLEELGWMVYGVGIQHHQLQALSKLKDPLNLTLDLRCRNITHTHIWERLEIRQNTAQHSYCSQITHTQLAWTYCNMNIT